eukprot:11514800-Alexandrium_andersonii.AAC.2
MDLKGCPNGCHAIAQPCTQDSPQHPRANMGMADHFEKSRLVRGGGGGGGNLSLIHISEPTRLALI